MRSIRQPTPILIRPGRVTAVTPTPRAPGRFDLLIDGEPACRLSIDSIERLHLNAGTEISDALAAQVAREAEVIRAYDRAMMMLAARGRAGRELRRLLVRKGEPPEAVDEAVARLQTAGFVDDAAFARQFVRHRAVTAGFSRRRIQGDLLRRGVDRSIVATAIAEVFAEERVDEAAAMEAAAQRRLRTMSRLDGPTRRRRLYAYLARRGYDADAIRSVVQRLTKDGGDRA